MAAENKILFIYFFNEFDAAKSRWWGEMVKSLKMGIF